MSSVILDKLNIERVMGGGKWDVINEWKNAVGVFGIYQDTSSRIGLENVYLLLSINGRVLILKQYPVGSTVVAQRDAMELAELSGAKIVV